MECALIVAKNQLTIYPMVAIIWLDAWGEEAQMSLHEIESKQARAQQFTSFGLLIKENEAGFVIAGEIEEDGAFRHVMFIPRGMVVEKIDLGIPKRKVKRRARKSSVIAVTSATVVMSPEDFATASKTTAV